MTKGQTLQLRRMAARAVNRLLPRHERDRLDKESIQIRLWCIEAWMRGWRASQRAGRHPFGESTRKRKGASR
jgi:hypothetical protein